MCVSNCRARSIVHLPFPTRRFDCKTAGAPEQKKNVNPNSLVSISNLAPLTSEKAEQSAYTSLRQETEYPPKAGCTSTEEAPSIRISEGQWVRPFVAFL